MVEHMTCPWGPHTHPVGTTWCMEMFAEIPAPDALATRPIPRPVDPPVVESLPPAPRSLPEPVSCPNCGDRGTPGEECRQCFTIIPGPGPGGPAVLVLPSGTVVRVPRDRQLTIGRESEVDAVSTALDPFDGVSRRHCLVTIDPVRDEITVRDPGSLNRTWLGDDPREIGPQEARVVALPALLRLGRNLTIRIEPEATP